MVCSIVYLQKWEKYSFPASNEIAHYHCSFRSYHKKLMKVKNRQILKNKINELKMKISENNIKWEEICFKEARICHAIFWIQLHSFKKLKQSICLE